MTDTELKELLDHEASRINSPEFVLDDPVQFPRQFEDVRDIEIASLLCASIAWGNRKMICRNCEKMMGLMDWKPFDFMMSEQWNELPDEMNLHRTFFVRNLKNVLSGLKEVYSKYDTLQNFTSNRGIAKAELPSWELVKGLNEYIHDARFLPQKLDTTALKRVNMALRWLVREDGIVDIGCWEVIKPRQLFIPLDTHVVATARELGLLSRKQADKKAVLEIMGPLRSFNPNDPVIYDFALFGIGMGL